MLKISYKFLRYTSPTYKSSVFSSYPKNPPATFAERAKLIATNKPEVKKRRCRRAATDCLPNSAVKGTSKLEYSMKDLLSDNIHFDSFVKPKKMQTARKPCEVALALSMPSAATEPKKKKTKSNCEKVAPAA